MSSGTLINRLEEVCWLVEAAARLPHKPVVGMWTHANSRGLPDLNIRFDNIDRTRRHRMQGASADRLAGRKGYLPGGSTACSRRAEDKAVSNQGISGVRSGSAFSIAVSKVERSPIRRRYRRMFV